MNLQTNLGHPMTHTCVSSLAPQLAFWNSVPGITPEVAVATPLVARGFLDTGCFGCVCVFWAGAFHSFFGLTENKFGSMTGNSFLGIEFAQNRQDQKLC